MSEENTEENTLYAVRTLKRGSDGMLYVRYVDEDTGEIIEDGDLENYEIRGFDKGTIDTPEDDPAPQSSPNISYPSRAAPRSEPSDSPNQGNVPTGREPTGPWNDPYTGPNQLGFMTKLQEGLNDFLDGSKFDKATQGIAKRAERVTDRISDFMRKEAERRQDLGIKDPGYIQPGDPMDLTNPTDQGPSLVNPTENVNPRAALPGVDDIVTSSTSVRGFPTNQIPGSAGTVPSDSFAKFYENEPTPQGTPTNVPTSRIDQAFDDAYTTNPYADPNLPTPDRFNQTFDQFLGPDPDEALQSGNVGSAPVDDVPTATGAEPATGVLGGPSNFDQFGNPVETFGETFDRGTGGFNPEQTTAQGVISEVVGNNKGADYSRHTQNLGPREIDAIADLANTLGLSVAEVAGVIGTETADTFSGAVDNGFGYKGAIQFDAENQAKILDKYGVPVDQMSFEEQLKGPVMDYLNERGFVPGVHDAADLYTTIHAGNPNAGVDGKDFANGKTTGQIFDQYVTPRIQSIDDYLGGSTYGQRGNYNPLGGNTTSSTPSSFVGGNFYNDVGGDSRDYGFSTKSISDNTNFGFSEPSYAGGRSTTRSVTTSRETGFTDSSIPGSSSSPSSSGFSGSSYGGSNYGGGYGGGYSGGGSDGGNPGNSSSPGGGGYDSSNTGGPGDYGNTSSGGYSQSDYDNNSSIGDWNDNNSWF